jgi:hypothetical protein
LSIRVIGGILLRIDRITDRHRRRPVSAPAGRKNSRGLDFPKKSAYIATIKGGAGAASPAKNLIEEYEQWQKR